MRPSPRRSRTRPPSGSRTSGAARSASVQAGDLLIGGRPALSVTQIDGDTFQFTIDPTARVGDGTYQVALAAGAVTDLAGINNVAFNGTFILDTTGPRIRATTWNGASLPSNRILPVGTLTFEAQLDENLYAIRSARRGLLSPGAGDITLVEAISGQSFNPAAGTARLKIGIPASSYPGKFKFDLRKPPAGIRIKSVSPSRDSVELTLEADAGKVKLGLKGNLTLLASADKAASTGKSKPPPTLPNVPFEIVRP